MSWAQPAAVHGRVWAVLERVLEHAHQLSLVAYAGIVAHHEHWQRYGLPQLKDARHLALGRVIAVPVLVYF